MIIKESKSLWNSPVFLVTKPDGSSRFLVDFRAVNAKTKPEFCVLPTLEEVFDQISDEKPNIFSVLDLRAGYYGVGLDENSQPCMHCLFNEKSAFSVYQIKYGIRELRFILHSNLCTKSLRPKYGAT